MPKSSLNCLAHIHVILNTINLLTFCLYSVMTSVARSCPDRPLMSIYFNLWGKCISYRNKLIIKCIGIGRDHPMTRNFAQLNLGELEREITRSITQIDHREGTLDYMTPFAVEFHQVLEQFGMECVKVHVKYCDNSNIFNIHVKERRMEERMEEDMEGIEVEGREEANKKEEYVKRKKMKKGGMKKKPNPAGTESKA